MYKLNLPDFDARIRQTDGHAEIYDPLRSRFVALTPEEWVRQHFVNFLTAHCGYKAALMANEVALHVGEKTVRADSVVYSKSLVPRMIVEYKAPTVAITEKTFHQALAYNSLLHVEFLAMSNGINHVYCRIDYAQQSFCFMKEPPAWSLIQGGNMAK